MGRYKKYISPVADTYAWCLMPNHFHLLLRIKEENEIVEVMRKTNLKNKNLQGFCKLNSDDKINKVNLGGLQHIKFINQQFSNLFNSYTKSYNKFFNTRGNLFNQNFKRKVITDEDSIIRLILYIHNNPVHHKFTKEIGDWPYSSFHSYLSADYSLLHRNALTDHFDDLQNFIFIHKQENLIRGDITLEAED
jgi:REP element-mobilizing transposase RayT